jgi:hypothetical protein
MPRKKAQPIPPITVSTVQNEIVSLDQPPPSDPPQPPPKAKREKKTSKHKVVAVITPDGIQGAFQSEVKRPLIAHLPIHSSEVKFHDLPLQYDPAPPCQPQAFNAGEIDPFASEAAYDYTQQLVEHKQEKVEQEEQELSKEPSSVPVAPQQPPQQSQQSSSQSYRKEFGPTTLLVEFAAGKSVQELPMTSKTSCFWCCEGFSGRPCVIPMRVIDNVWNVYGNFCNPQCAMAYLLSEIIDTHTRWERIALLNRLYSENTNGRIYPAPIRETLKTFGGPMSIEEFRSLCDSQRTRVDVHMPPMVSILASMDTKPIDFYETPLRNTFSSPNQYVRPVLSEEPTGLKLKRSKPLKDKDSTLDTCLQIKVRS